MRVHHGHHRGSDPHHAGTGFGGHFRGKFAAHFAGRGFGGFDDPFGSDAGEGFGGHRGGPRGGGGRRRMFASGELRLLLLHLVAQEPRHGYELIKAIGELAGGDYAPSPGVVYPTLSLLLDEAVIAEVDGDGPRKAFTATDSGRAELTLRHVEAEALVDRLKGLAQERQRHDSPPIRRAIGNLFAALRHRALAGAFDTETAYKVADILDEAARRIERL